MAFDQGVSGAPSPSAQRNGTVRVETNYPDQKFYNSSTDEARYDRRSDHRVETGEYGEQSLQEGASRQGEQPTHNTYYKQDSMNPEDTREIMQAPERSFYEPHGGLTYLAPTHLAEPSKEESGESPVWLFSQKTVASWLSWGTPFDKECIYHEKYIEFRHKEMKGCLKSTSSNSPGVAFTLGNQKEEDFATKYIRNLQHKNNRLEFEVICAESADVNGIIRGASLSDEPKKRMLPLSELDVDALAKASPHPESVLSACEIAYALHRRSSLSQRPPSFSPQVDHASDVVINGPDHLRVLNDLPSFTHASIQLIVNGIDQVQSREQPTIIEFRDLNDKRKLADILNNNRNAHVKYRFRKSGEKLSTEDLVNLTYLAHHLPPNLDHLYLDDESLTLRHIVDANSRKWISRDPNLELDDKLSQYLQNVALKNNIYLIGSTGEGKSSTFNSLLGLKRGDIEPKKDGNEYAKVSSGKSTTAEIQEGYFYEEDNRSDKSKKWIIIDTPGLNDDQSREDSFLKALCDFIATKGTANMLCLVKKDVTRLTRAEQIMLSKYRESFGDNFGKMLRIICTNSSILMDDMDEEENDGPTVESFRQMMVEQVFEPYGLIGDQQIKNRIYYIGKVPRKFPSKLDPLTELDRLRKDIKDSERHPTVGASCLWELLERTNEFWKDEGRYGQLHKEAISRMWFATRTANKNVHKSSNQTAVFAMMVPDVVSIFKNFFHLGNASYAGCAREVVIRAETRLSRIALRKAVNVQHVLNYAKKGAFVLGFTGIFEYVEKGRMISAAQFELIERNKPLGRDQKKRIACFLTDTTLEDLEKFLQNGMY